MRGVRSWNRGTGAAGTAMVLLLGMGTAGCSLFSSDGKDGKPITVGTTATVSHLDPAGAYDTGSWSLYGNVYQSLMTFAPGGATPVPDAAKSCGFKDGGMRVYTCKLRSGLKFANGHALTVKDVKFSFERVKRINSPQGAAVLLQTLQSVETSGDDEVVFRLGSSDATFPFKVASGVGSIVDSTRYPADKLREGGEVDGSGPYQLKRFQKGSLAELTPNDHYHGAIKSVGGPVTVKYFSDPQSLSDSWDKRAVDVVNRDMPPAKIAKLSASNSDERVIESSAPSIRSMIFNMRKDSPLKEVAVRQAIANLIDRPGLARDVHSRTVEPLYSLIPQGFAGHTTPFFDLYPKPDPDRARQLLQRAGVSTPVHFALAYSQGAATKEEAALLKKQLESSGLFTVDAKYVEWQEFQEGYAKGAYDAYCLSWFADYPDPDTFTSPLVSTDNTIHSGYSNSRVDKLIRAAQLTTSRVQGTEEFRTIQKIVAEDVPMIPLWQKKDYVLTKPSISGGQYLTDGTGLWRLWRLGRI